MIQRAKLQEKEEKKFIKKIQKKREKEAITHSENISRIRNERLDRFRIIIGKHEHAMIESLVQTRSQSPKEVKRFSTFRFRKVTLPAVSPVPLVPGKNPRPSIAVTLSRLTTPSSKRVDFFN